MHPTCTVRNKSTPTERCYGRARRKQTARGRARDPAYIAGNAVPPLLLPTQGVNVAHVAGKAEDLMKKMDVNADNHISVSEFTYMVRASAHTWRARVSECAHQAVGRKRRGTGRCISAM